MKYSQETITHFRCQACESLFSIADFHLVKDKMAAIYCPVCGEVEDISQLEKTEEIGK